MNLEQIIAIIGTALQMAKKVWPTAVQGYEDIKFFAEGLFKQLKGDDNITPEEQAALEAKLDELSAELQQPLPPE